MAGIPDRLLRMRDGQRGMPDIWGGGPPSRSSPRNGTHVTKVRKSLLRCVCWIRELAFVWAVGKAWTTGERAVRRETGTTQVCCGSESWGCLFPTRSFFPLEDVLRSSHKNLIKTFFLPFLLFCIWWFNVYLEAFIQL